MTELLRQLILINKHKYICFWGAGGGEGPHFIVVKSAQRFRKERKADKIDEKDVDGFFFFLFQVSNETEYLVFNFYLLIKFVKLLARLKIIITLGISIGNFPHNLTGKYYTLHEIHIHTHIVSSDNLYKFSQ